MSNQPTFQTVKLARGKHGNPDAGVCAVELASMLAGEPFSDRPACVDSYIAGFLRAYNDTVGDERRQDLYAVAAKVVGTAVPMLARVSIERRNMLLQFAVARRARYRGRALTTLGDDGPGVLAVRSLGTIDDAKHQAALKLIDDLIAVGKVSPPAMRDGRKVLTPRPARERAIR